MNLLFFLTEETTSETTSSQGFDWQNFFNDIWTWICTQGLKLLFGIIVLFILFKVVNAISRAIRRKMESKHQEPTVTMVLYNVIRIGLKLLLVLLFISYIGIDTAGIGVVLSSIGIGFSLAIQGSLSNFAGGLVILIMKPFRIGDYVVAQGCEGTVENIHLFYTYLTTPDNRVQMIPNGVLANGVITNVSMKDTRRVDFTFSISYQSSIDKASESIRKVLSEQKNIFRTPEPLIAVGELAESSINLRVRVWVKKQDYWNVFFFLNDAIFRQLVEDGIQIPYPQLDVHLDNVKD